MPQFDFANVFWPQVAWLAVFFAILYFGVVRLTLPKLGGVMQAREDQVSGDLNLAEKAKAEADRLASAHAEAVSGAQEAARTALANARSSAAAKVEQELAKADAGLAGQAAEKQKSIAVAKTKAVGEIEAVAADAAGDIVEKLTGTRPSARDAAVAVRSALG